MQDKLREDDGVHLEYRLDGSVFNIQRLKSRTKTSSLRITDLQYADDAALLAHTAESMQHILNTISSIYQALGLQINTRKTEVIVQQVNPNQEVPRFTINDTQLHVVPLFKYLGSIVTPNARIDDDVLEKINKASCAFGRLRTRVFQNKHLKLSTKIQVYEAICLTTLLYGAESWTIYSHHLKKLEQFHISCLQKILGLTWRDRVPHTQILERTKSTSIEALITKRQLRWLGHVIRMPDNRLPKQVLYGQLKNGHRRPGGPKKRFKDQVKSSLKKCKILPSALEGLAGDRSNWRKSISTGVAILEQDRIAHRTLKRQQRHNRQEVPAVANVEFTCPTCGKLCMSRIGLVSHLNAHRCRADLRPYLNLIIHSSIHSFIHSCEKQKCRHRKRWTGLSK